MNTTLETAHSHIKEHGKLLNLLYKGYCLLEKDYSHSGLTSPKIQIQTVFYAPDGWIIQKSGEQGCRYLISHLIWYYASWVAKSNSGVLRFRNKQASKSSSLRSTLHKERHGNIHFITVVFIYMREGLHTLKSCFNRNPTITVLACLQKGMTSRFDDAASEHFDDHLGKKYQESTKTKKYTSRMTLVLYN